MILFLIILLIMTSKVQPGTVNQSSNAIERPAIRACSKSWLTSNKSSSSSFDKENQPSRKHIVRGLTTAPGEFFYMCALGWSSPGDNELIDFKCGGVLIASSYILTAAHCAYVNGQPPVVAFPGGHNLTDTSVKKYEIAQVIVHPEYNPETAYNDVALIKTKKPMNLRNPCLGSELITANQEVTIVGYGHTKLAGPSSSHLLKAKLITVSNKECSNYYEPDFSIPRGIVDQQICARDREQLRDTCQGDSGGPLIMQRSVNNEPARPYIVGVTSFGQGCAGEPPGVYTRISEYIEWIEGIVWHTQ